MRYIKKFLESYNQTCNISILMGKTLKDIIVDGNESILFICSDGEKYIMNHCQNCCESVSIDDINGDIKDLIGSPITLAEETNNDNPIFDRPLDGSDESYEWTFYRLATIKGYVNIRWYGTSNGYYSTSVDFTRAN